MTVIGMIAAKNIGVDTVMRRTVETTLKQQASSVENESGIPLSVASTSLLKRFMIRPDGVESKNSIVLLTIDCSIRLCKIFAPFSFNTKNTIFEPKYNKKIET